MAMKPVPPDHPEPPDAEARRKIAPVVCYPADSPGGDCSAEHSSDTAPCHPLQVTVFRPAAPPAGWSPPPRNAYDGSHGA